MESGSTLKANNLVETDRILDISGRLVVNRAAFKMRSAELTPDGPEIPRAGGAGLMPLHLNIDDPDFEEQFDALVNARREADEDVSADVKAIIGDVRARGDECRS